MESAKTKLTVFFEPPFWTGLIERETGDRYEVCRVIFGAEPSDAEVYAYVLDRYGSLKFSPALEVERQPERTINPKRAQRMAQKQHQPIGIGTKAQQALQLQREQSKMKRRICSREIRQAEEERQYHLRQAKRKEKHRGR